MSDQLPKHLLVSELAERGAVISGSLALQACLQLRDSCMGDEADIQVHLTFAIGPKGQYRITGWVRTQLPMQCQRCLQMMQQPVDSMVKLEAVSAGSEPSQGYEPIELDLQGMVSLVDLVEQECLLQLPLVVRHPDTGCQSKMTDTRVLPEAKQPNPFAVLEGLKKTKRED